ncbi:MAG: polysaccharide biosynthesis tyrosine autokinase [Verrucomicrobia bacterium]|nr:MAG: polysaccharide biosynthesis tyrosine autokinase [Verrucomicrobiota bacterium]
MEAIKTQASAASGISDSKLHFLDYWRILRLRKAIILTVFLLVVGTVAVVTHFLTPLYLSTVGMKVEKDTPDVGPFLQGPSQTGFDPYFFNTEFEVLKSRRILDKVSERLHLAKVYAGRAKVPEINIQQTYEVLSRAVEVRQRRNTSIIEISAYDQDAALAADIANRIAEAYEQDRDLDRNDRLLRGLTTLSNALSNLEEQVRVAQTNVDHLRMFLKVPDAAETPSLVSLNTQTMAKLELSRTEYRTQAATLEQLMEKVNSKKGDELRHFLSSARPTQELTALIASLNLAKQKQRQLSPDLGPEHPEVKRVIGLISEINDQLDKEVQGMVDALSAQLEIARGNVRELEKLYDSAIEKTAQENKSFAPYAKAKRDLEFSMQVRQSMRLQLNQELINGQISKKSSVQVIDRALQGLTPVRPNKPLFVAAGAIFGLLLGIGLAFFIEYIDTSVKTIDDVEQSLGAPVLGVIPQNVGALINEGADSPHAEAYRVLRTNILFSRKDPGCRTMTVVSGGAGEGKSTTIFNLATIFAQQGSRVLIVDSDLRRPSLHKILNVSNTVGLTNFLLRTAKLEEVVQTTPQPGLDFLPSGKLPSSSVGILNSVQMKEFIEEVKNRYDFVFFDSPPIMGVSDASILVSEVEMAILVVQYRKYPQQMTLRAKQMVEKIGGAERLLGVVLNNINISQDSYYYYYSGYYYDYYSKSEDSKPDGEKKKKSRSGKAGAAVADDKSAEVKPKY